MRKFIYLLTIAILIGLIVIKSNVNDIGIEYIYTNDYIYQINSDDSLTLIEYLNSDGLQEVIIPSFIDSREVKCIGPNCFDCSNLTSITINDNIVMVKKEAFYNCESLSYLSVPANLNCHQIFIGLNNLEMLKISYGNNGFMYDYSYDKLADWHDSCESIKSLVLADSICYLGDYCFTDLVNLQEIIMDCSIESVGKYCFYNTSNLNGLSFDLSLKRIKERAFKCDKDKNVDATLLIPQSVKYFGNDCFDERYNYLVYKDSRAQYYLEENDIDYNLLDISFAEEVNTLVLGESYKLNVVDDSLNQLTYISSNKQVATIDNDGNITTNSLGTFTVTVNSGSATNNMQIKVISQKDKSSDVYYHTLKVGEAITIDNKDNYSYQLSDDNLIEIDNNKFEAVRSGSCKIYLSNGIIYNINIINPIKDIILDKQVITIKKGYSYQIEVDYEPYDADNKALSYSSSNEKIATVNRFGKITALKDGSCTISISTNDGSDITKELMVNVSSASIKCEVDSFPLMKGKYFRLNCSGSNGEKLIYRSNNEKIAKVDKNGKVYGVSEGVAYIIVSNEKMTAFSIVTVKVYEAFSYGIDLSEWNGTNYTIDNFKKIKKDGIDFVILRAGYDKDYKDGSFENNYQNAKKAGLDVGAYHYIVSQTTYDAIKEAKWMIELLDGKQFEYPIVVDIEANGHKYLSVTEFSSIVAVYCDTLKEAGYYPIVYSYGSLLNKNQTGYDNWIAQWDSERVTTLQQDYTIWQFTSKGQVDGVNGYVDMDICFTDYPSYIKKNHYNGY